MPLPLVPVAIGGAKLLTALGVGTGVTSAVARNVPFIRNKAIKDAKTSDQYNPATGKLRQGSEYNIGDQLKGLLGGYTKDDVLASEKKEFKTGIEEDFGAIVNKLGKRYTQAGLRVPAGLSLEEGDNRETYRQKITDYRGKINRLEELQGLLQPGQTLASLGVTSESNTGTINNTKRQLLAADPMSPQSLYMDQRRIEEANRQEARQTRLADQRRQDQRFELERGDNLRRERDNLLQQQKMFDFNVQQYNDRLDRQDRLDRMEQRRLTGQAIGAAVQAIGGFF